MPSPIDLNTLIKAKLPFWPTLQRAFALTFDNLPALARISWKWLLLLLPFQLLYFRYAFPHLSAVYEAIGSHKVPEQTPFLVMLLAVVLGIVGYLLFSAPAVSWHRLILRRIQSDSVMRVDTPTLQYAGYVFFLYSLFNVPVLLQQLVTPAPGTLPSGMQVLAIIVSMVAMFAAMFFLFRTSVFLPGIAVENPDATLSNVLSRTRGNTFRLFFGNFLAMLPFALVAMVANYLILSRAEPLIGTLLLPVANLVSYVGIAVSLAFTSLAYRFFYEDGR